jgi:hypothetical protein
MKRVFQFLSGIMLCFCVGVLSFPYAYAYIEDKGLTIVQKIGIMPLVAVLVFGVHLMDKSLYKNV